MASFSGAAPARDAGVTDAPPPRRAKTKRVVSARARGRAGFAGWLYKASGGTRLRVKFDKRFFVLQDDVLAYYLSEDLAVKKGEVPLAGAELRGHQTRCLQDAFFVCALSGRVPEHLVETLATFESCRPRGGSRAGAELRPLGKGAKALNVFPPAECRFELRTAGRTWVLGVDPRHFEQRREWLEVLGRATGDSLAPAASPVEGWLWLRKSGKKDWAERLCQLSDDTVRAAGAYIKKQGRDMDGAWRRVAAPPAAATWRRVAAPPRPRRGSTREDESRRRRGCDVAIPRRRAAAWRRAPQVRARKAASAACCLEIGPLRGCVVERAAAVGASKGALLRFTATLRAGTEFRPSSRFRPSFVSA